MKLGIERPHQQYKSSLLVKLRAVVDVISKTDDSNDSNVENFTVELSRYGNGWLLQTPRVLNFHCGMDVRSQGLKNGGLKNG